MLAEWQNVTVKLAKWQIEIYSQQKAKKAERNVKFSEMTEGRREMKTCGMAESAERASR